MTDSTLQIDREQCRQAAAVCACFNFRKASRAVTSLFDESLSPCGLRSTQLVILITLAVEEGIPVARLGQALVMDRSTVARNLKPLEREGLVAVAPGSDRRTRLVHLTDRGRGKLLSAIPYWHKAQTHFVQQIGSERWTNLLGDLNRAVQASGRR